MEASYRNWPTTFPPHRRQKPDRSGSDQSAGERKIRCMRRRTNEHTLDVEKLSDAELNAIASGKVAGEMDQTAGHRELFPASFWVDDYYLTCSANGDIRAAFRLPANHHEPSEPSFTLTASWVFYLWEPDCVKAWSALAPQAVSARRADASEPPSPRRKPGRKPRGNWKLEVATEVGLHYRQGKPPPAAKELAQFCQDELGFQPDISEIQKWLRQLLG